MFLNHIEKNKNASTYLKVHTYTHIYSVVILPHFKALVQINLDVLYKTVHREVRYSLT